MRCADEIHVRYALTKARQEKKERLELVLLREKILLLRSLRKETCTGR